jgi:hypothetical protein
MQDANQITTGTHIFFAIASACFAWCLFAKPAMTLVGKNKNWKDFGLILLVLFIYCIVLPSIMLSNESYKLDIYGEDNFRLVKFLSVILGICTIQFCLCYNYLHNTKFAVTILTVVTYLLFVVNITEACVVSFLGKNTPDFDGVTELPEMNLLLGIVSVIIIVSLCINFFKGSKVEMNLDQNQLKLKCNFSWALIAAYTFWNLGFKIQEIESPLVLLYFVVSLLLPVVTHKLDIGDWLQVRGLTLLFVIIIELGLAHGEGSIFPAYNKLGYNKKQTQDSSITKLLSNRDFKIFLIVMAMLTSCYELGTSIIL